MKKTARVFLGSLPLALALLGVSAPKGYSDETTLNRFSIGPRAAYVDPKDSDDTAWMGGAQVRLPLGEVLAAEGSIDYRSDKYADGAVRVRTYPVQATLLAYLAPQKPISPYLLAGAGWYFTQVKMDNPLVHLDETDSRLGVHAGTGLTVALSPQISLDGSYRYVWLDNFKTKDASLQDKEFNDSGHMVTVALNFGF